MPRAPRSAFDPGPPLRRFVAAELGRAQRQLRRQGNNLDSGIHQGRKSLRRARAAMALGGAALGDAAARLDRALRAQCRSLSRERDAHAVIGTLLHIEGSPTLAPGDIPAARAALQQRRDRVLARRLARDPGLAAWRRRLARLADRIDALPWSAVAAGDVHAALARALRRCARAERHALRHADSESLHRWRRRLRRLRQQISALEKISGLDWSEYAAVPDPADALSEAQDLAVLRQVLRRLQGLDGKVRQRLLQALADQ